MNSEVLTTALVSVNLSSSGKELISGDVQAILSDVTKRHRDTKIAANVDSRYIAVSTYEVTRMFDVAAQMDEAAYSAIMNSVQLELLITKLCNPSSILAVTANLTRPIFYELAHNNGLAGVSWNFVNNASLFLFEENIKNRYPATSFGYTVYDKDEITSDRTEKFDMVMAHAASFIDDDNYLESIVDNLATGGVMLVHATNDASSLYKSNYKWHTHYDLHKILSSKPGKSFHVPSFYGTTVYIKG